MKRLTVTLFAAFYAIALIAGVVDRTSVWAAEKAEAAVEKASGPAVRAAKEVTPRHPNRRMLQSPFVVAPPVLESGVTLISNPYNLLAPSTPVWRLDSAPVPSRAPPFIA